MYDINFENRLLEIKNNTMICNLEPHIIEAIDTIIERTDSLAKVINTLHVLSKEGKGIKFGNVKEYHVLKEKDSEKISAFFRNPIEQRFFDLSVYDEKYKGVIIQNKQSEELIQVCFYNRLDRDDELNAFVNIERRFIKGIVTPTDFYHIHRGIDNYCFGDIRDGLLDSIKFSFAQTMNNVIEGLRSINFDDTISNGVRETNELCFFGNHYEGSMDNLNLRNSISKMMSRNTSTKLSDIGFYGSLKKLTDSLHSYHKDCYCYYCTCIHLIKMDRERITTDDLSRIIVDRKTFEKLLVLPDTEKKDILANLDSIKNNNFTSTIELDTELFDMDDVSDYVDNNLGDLIESLTERYDGEIEECREYAKEISDTESDISRLEETVKHKRGILKDKPTTSQISTIEFLLGDTHDRKKEEEKTEYTQQEQDYDDAKNEIGEIDDEIDSLGSKLDDLRDSLRNHDYENLYLWTEGDYTNGDIGQSYSDEIYEMANDWIENREVDQEGCTFEDSYRNRLKDGDKIDDMIRSMLPISYSNYEHYVVQTNGLITSEMWKEKLDAERTVIVDNLGELYIKQHDGVDMDKIRNTVSTIVGCGTLGSNIAYTMSRLGYRIFSLIDYDAVTLHNLPNQYFKHSQITGYKTVSLRENLLEILPESTLPMIFGFENSFEDYRQYNGDIPVMMNTHTDVFFLVTDNLESRYNVVKFVKELANETATNYLIIDCRMNDLNKYVIYAYYIGDSDNYETHLRTMLDKDGELIKLEDDNVCGLQSSILVALECSLKVIDILNKYHDGDKIPFLTTNEF